MNAVVCLEFDARKWASIAADHADAGLSAAMATWQSTDDELCAEYQARSESCRGCPVKGFTGAPNCHGAKYWLRWADAIAAADAIGEKREGAELLPALNAIAEKAAKKHGKMLEFLAAAARRR